LPSVPAVVAEILSQYSSWGLTWSRQPRFREPVWRPELGYVRVSPAAIIMASRVQKDAVQSNPKFYREYGRQQDCVGLMAAGEENMTERLGFEPKSGRVRILGSETPRVPEEGVLAEDFGTFLENWSKVGFVSTAWITLGVFRGPRGLLDPTCRKALVWRRWLFGRKGSA